MKKGLFFATFCCITLFVSSCGPRWDRGNVQTVKRAVSEFNSVEISAPVDAVITVREGAPASVLFKGYDGEIKEIKTEVVDGVLKLYQEDGFSFDIDENVKAEIVVGTLSSLTISGAADVKTEGNIKAAEFVLTVSGAGDVKIDEINATKLTVEAAGAADIDIKRGMVTSAQYHFSGAGDLKAYGLQSKEVSASVAGAGDIKVSVSDALSASISGVGSIHYKGNPPTLTKSISGIGSIVDAN